jgi:hypothetical protein
MLNEFAKVLFRCHESRSVSTSNLDATPHIIGCIPVMIREHAHLAHIVPKSGCRLADALWLGNSSNDDNWLVEWKHMVAVTCEM